MKGICLEVEWVPEIWFLGNQVNSKQPKSSPQNLKTQMFYYYYPNFMFLEKDPTIYVEGLSCANV